MIAGLGKAGRDHVKALEGIPYAQVVAGIDTNRSLSLTFRERDLPVFTSAFDASTKEPNPDIVVVATPTRSHAEICEDISANFPDTTILVEKPAADNLDDARRIVEGVGAKRRVDVAYHLAFSPEVGWALGRARERAAELGTPVAIEARSADPYQLDLDSARASLGSSWIDSGINALSVIERFATLVRRESLRTIGPESHNVFEGRFTCQAAGSHLPATVLTSWHATAPARTTCIKYSSGAEIVMDHHAVVGYLLNEGEVSEIFGSDGATPRREAHYRALYRSWLSGESPVFSAKSSLRLHRLLLEPDRAG
jgi:predicted dehydrogenase